MRSCAGPTGHPLCHVAPRSATVTTSRLDENGAGGAAEVDVVATTVVPVVVGPRVTEVVPVAALGVVGVDAGAVVAPVPGVAGAEAMARIPVTAGAAARPLEHADAARTTPAAAHARPTLSGAEIETK